MLISVFIRFFFLLLLFLSLLFSLEFSSSRLPSGRLAAHGKTKSAHAYDAAAVPGPEDTAAIKIHLYMA